MVSPNTSMLGICPHLNEWPTDRPIDDDDTGILPIGYDDAGVVHQRTCLIVCGWWWFCMSIEWNKKRNPPVHGYARRLRCCCCCGVDKQTEKEREREMNKTIWKRTGLGSFFFFLCLFVSCVFINRVFKKISMEW